MDEGPALIVRELKQNLIDILGQLIQIGSHALEILLLQSLGLFLYILHLEPLKLCLQGLAVPLGWLRAVNGVSPDRAQLCGGGAQV